MRRRGVALKMVKQLQSDYPGHPIRALCPVGYESNKFWEGIGCKHGGLKILRESDEEWNGAPQAANIWLLPAIGYLESPADRLDPLPTDVFNGKRK